MASRQSEAVRELHAGWARARLNGEEQDNEHWGDLTRDPGGVDYIETGADGVAAMWVIPMDAAGDRAAPGSSPAVAKGVARFGAPLMVGCDRGAATTRDRRDWPVFMASP